MSAANAKDFTRWLGRELRDWTLYFLIALVVLNATPLARDDTDAGEWGGGRSGISPRTDALTGCQYLEGTNGGITPRLDSRGNHLGCEEPT